jgi:hypothetical protein
VVSLDWRVQNRVFPRKVIKSQILADYVSEWTEIQMPPPKERLEHWIMYFDSALKLEGAGAGVLLISPQGEQLKYVLQKSKSTTRLPTMEQNMKP